MQRVTITLDDDLMTEIDRMVKSGVYQNRSEAIRDMARSGIHQAAERQGNTGDCVAALVYVYDHQARDLSRRLTHAFHEHHHLSLSSLHLHLDHDSCMEVTVLHGAEKEVRDFADHVVAERGVKHGRLVTIPVKFEESRHAHGKEQGPRHTHMHVRNVG